MRRAGQARKRDVNERAIVDALEAVGANVMQLSGKGIPDLLVAFRGTWMPLEVKSEKGRLTTAQDEWTGPVIAIVRSVDEALSAIGAI